jgi:hypothetical protein
VTATHSVNGGGTGNEFPRNLLLEGTEPWNKWYEHTSNHADVYIDFTEAITFSGFGYRMANDVPNRDPSVITAFYWDASNDKWVQVHQVYPSGLARWAVSKHATIMSAAKKFKFSFFNNKMNEIQLGEIIFYKCPIVCHSDTECCPGDGWRTNSLCACDQRVDCCPGQTWLQNSLCVCDRTKDCCPGNTW